MIYALLNLHQVHADCLAIAQAILTSDAVTVERYVLAEVIVHAMQARQRPGPFYCLYCRDAVHLTEDRPPVGRTAANPWHFEHDTIGECIGHTRNSPTPHALGIENPARHGCYVLLGCESTPRRDRGSCQTINAGCTYCHLAKAQTSPCV